MLRASSSTLHTTRRCFLRTSRISAVPLLARPLLSSRYSVTARRLHAPGRPVTGPDAAEAVFGLKGKSESDPAMRAALEQARVALTASAKPLILQPKSVGLLLNGLRKCSSASPLVSSVLAAVVQSIKAARPGEFRALDVSRALYGLQSCSSAVREVRAVLQALARIISSCAEALDAQGVGNALYGLRFCSSDAPEVRTVLNALAPKIASCGENLKAQGVSNALYGLRFCSSTVPEMRAVLNALAPKIAGCRENFKPQELGNALYGLRICSSDVPEVRAVLNALVPKIASCRNVLDAQSVGNALYGLRYCNSDVPEVRAVLKALAPNCESCVEPLGAQEVCNALFGLQNCSSDIPEVRSLLQLLGTHAAKLPGILRARHLGQAFTGLQRISSSVRSELLSVLARHTVQLASTSTALSDGDLLYMVHGLVALRLAPSYPVEHQLATFRDACIAELARRKPALSNIQSGSYFSTIAVQLLAQYFGDKFGCSCGGPEYVHGYRADIVVRIQAGDSSLTLINVEFHDLHDAGFAKRRYTTIRDTFLRSRGVLVERWDLAAHHAAPVEEQNERFGEWFIGVLKRAGCDAGSKQ
jgi:hypothetical protein